MTGRGSCPSVTEYTKGNVLMMESRLTMGHTSSWLGLCLFEKLLSAGIDTEIPEYRGNSSLSPSPYHILRIPPPFSLQSPLKKKTDC